jgi:hypothetical protein
VFSRKLETIEGRWKMTEMMNDSGVIDRLDRAPIALFTYNRPDHTKETIRALQANYLAEESDLFVFSDAPKNPESLSAVLEVRDYLRRVSGFKSVTIIERTNNYGLAKSIINGVTDICDRYGNVIVLEDDLVTSRHFLKYMNDALTQYKADERVISIHGYIYPLRKTLPETFFLRGADCWGWATWKRGWDLFEPDAQKLYEAVLAGGEIKIFDFDGNYGYANMLRQQIEGKVNSWAIRWYASAFLAGKLTLYPGISLVQNIGNDSSGTHCGNTDAFAGKIAEQPVQVGGIPVVASGLAYEAVSRYFKSLRLPLMQRVRNKIKTLRSGWAVL